MDEGKINSFELLEQSGEFILFKSELKKECDNIRGQIHRNLRRREENDNVLLEGKIMGLEMAIGYCSGQIAKNTSILNRIKGMVGGKKDEK